MGNYVHVDAERVEKVTVKAILFVIDGVDVWIPLSQISPADRDQYEAGDKDVSVCITEWIAQQKGLL